MTIPPLLVFGRNGQVAQCLVEAGARTKRPVVALGRNEIDVLDGQALRAAIAVHKPHAVVNAAAYTAVDKAESEEGEAMRLNAEAPRLMAEASEAAGLPFLHISTDYVFDGTLDRPYTEDDTPNPQGAYGRTKLAGELAVAAVAERHLVLRTAWVFSENANNFMKTMIRLGAERPQLRVVDDQRGCPTYAGHIAAALIVLAERMNDETAPAGTFHMAAEGEVSWHGFAAAIFEECAARGLKFPQELLAIPTSEYPTPAKRPANSVLDCSRLLREFGVRLPHWRDGLALAMDRYQVLNSN
ncbi:dTDP-4-dehydrorhamnose reductase [Lutibaculum baratangense]|uniref:dTDP-4-dehydrorhamnose reductase n=1 Tax=Lutibaculum baratangense AMV1 TaxID=631454 RepID=V4R8X4_9HYPH|nr:dTDP-4-dehydrorhamnose reductase [Lutibaculum baratangense]ESR22641.1 dTDP-4-dehydrorhamnose reductase [Lutibaculum baratangense AMV1]